MPRFCFKYNTTIYKYGWRNEKSAKTYCLIYASEFLARTRMCAYIKFFTLATVAALQYYLIIR
jgi:hypothetical protein